MFRRYQSGDVTQKYLPSAVLYCCSVFIHFIHSVALLQAVLQANTEPLRTCVVQTKNRAIETRDGLLTLLIPVQFPFKMKRSKLTCTFKHEILNFIIIILYYPMNFTETSQIWKILLAFCLSLYFLCQSGNKHFDVHF